MALLSTDRKAGTNMKAIRIEMTKVNLKTGLTKEYYAMVSNTQTPEYHTYSLTYEGYRTDWKEVA